MGPFPASRSGFACLLVMQDLFTKWVECCLLRKVNGKKIREVIEDLIINRWERRFINRDLKAFAEEHKIAHTIVPPYHPQANPLERVNRRLKNMITAFIEQDHRDWDLHLAEFFGDRVWKRQHVLSSAAHAISAKLATKYHGPFTISKILLSVVYELADEENKVIGKTHFRQFLRECAELMETTADRHPYFWAGLREELGRARLAWGNRHERAMRLLQERTAQYKTVP
ncbi:hypothetical protein ACFW04_014746 [Cataglyphis niger]